MIQTGLAGSSEGAARVVKLNTTAKHNQMNRIMEHLGDERSQT